MAGLPGTVTWTVTNQGNMATTAAWHDAVYLSADGQIDANAILLATQPEGCDAAGSKWQLPGQRRPLPFPWDFPPGTYSLLVDTDYDQAQTESTYANNFARSASRCCRRSPTCSSRGWRSVRPAACSRAAA